MQYWESARKLVFAQLYDSNAQAQKYSFIYCNLSSNTDFEAFYFQL